MKLRPGMTIKQARNTIYAILGVALIAALIAVISSKYVFIYIAAGIVLVAAVFSYFTMRCPACGHYLKIKKSKGNACPYCHSVLTDNK